MLEVMFVEYGAENTDVRPKAIYNKYAEIIIGNAETFRIHTGLEDR